MIIFAVIAWIGFSLLVAGIALAGVTPLSLLMGFLSAALAVFIALVVVLTPVMLIGGDGDGD